ncbi:hypothetical protein ACHAWO_011757 [Cyclotella atomus]|uniref:Uncharacterized protein n=1 Tax=Cyclotella atomus TaxID=382360 RepID=A0ABD3PLI2_9STRA
MNSRRIYLQAILLILLLPAVASFIVQPTTLLTSTAAAKESLTNLNLHVDPIHLHRDSLLRLDDPMLLGKETKDSHHPWITSSKQIHKFTNSLAPLVLALYLIGYYLSHYYHDESNGEMIAMMHHNIPVDPMFVGGLLVGAGLYMMKWSVDRTFLSPS